MTDDAVKAFLRARGARADLIAGGWPALVAAWRAVVASIESGYRLTMDDYLNDMDLRQIVEEAKGLVGPDAWEEISELDRRAKSHLKPVSRCVWGDAAAKRHGWSARKQWWYYAVPVNTPS
jgi:hypothetical protein